MFKNKINFNHLSKVVTWLLLSFKKEGSSVPLQGLLALITKLSILDKSRGTNYLILYIKSVRTNLSSYLSGNSLKDKLSKTTKDGIPIILGDLIPIVRSGKSFLLIAMIYTILFSTRSLNLGKSYDLSSITQPINGDVNGLDIHMRSFWKELGYLRPSKNFVPKSLKANTKVYRSKSGPNGHALISSYTDVLLINDELLKDLTLLGGKDLGYSIWLTKHPRMQEYMRKFFKPLSKVISNPVLRRLSYFPDKENKVRVIGILDWFSQVALKPLHLYLMKTLSRIPQDCTLDQQKFVNLIKNKDIYYSVDLSNATDRFPIDLISNLLKAQLPDNYVNAWKRVMVGIPFFIEGKFVSYSVGNPMGAYSSFNSFALTHHYLIYYCCKQLKKNWKTLPYCLLGDDIVICDEQVAVLYKSLLVKIGVEFSPLKTHESKHFYEFAKRLFYKGFEVSPFPYSALRECGKSYDMLTTLLWSLNNKGNWIPKDDVLLSVSSYYKIVMNRPDSFIKERVLPKSWLCLGMLNVISGLRNADDFLNEIIRTKNYQLPQLSLEVCLNILSNCVVQAFADSNIAKALDFNLKDMPLYGISEGFNKGFMEYQADLADEDPDFDGQFITYLATPLPQAQDAVYEEYLDLLKEIENLDKTGSNWSFKLRTFALPRTDKSILDRGDYLLSKAARSFGNLVDEQLMILQQYPQLLNF